MVGDTTALRTGKRAPELMVRSIAQALERRGFVADYDGSTVAFIRDNDDDSMMMNARIELHTTSPQAVLGYAVAYPRRGRIQAGAVEAGTPERIAWLLDGAYSTPFEVTQ